MSAHFVLLSRNDNEVVATVRLTPFPYPKLPTTTVVEQDNGEYPLGIVRTESSILSEFIQTLKLQAQHEGSFYVGVKLSRLAVRKAYRSNGLGAMTVRSAEFWLLQMLSAAADGKYSENIQELNIIISSQQQVQHFYEKLSYVIEGEPYDEEGMPHVLCTKRIKIKQ